MLGYRSSQHTLMATCFSRVILVVSYIGLYLSWVPPRVLHLWPNYPPRRTHASYAWRRLEHTSRTHVEHTPRTHVGQRARQARARGRQRESECTGESKEEARAGGSTSEAARERERAGAGEQERARERQRREERERGRASEAARARASEREREREREMRHRELGCCSSSSQRSLRRLSTALVGLVEVLVGQSPMSTPLCLR